MVVHQQSPATICFGDELYGSTVLQRSQLGWLGIRQCDGELCPRAWPRGSAWCTIVFLPFWLDGNKREIFVMPLARVRSTLPKTCERGGRR